MEINLSEAQMQEAVTSAIVGSVLGDALKKTIEAEVHTALKGGYQKPSVVETMVKSIVHDAVSGVVNERRDEIRQLVAERLTDEMLTTMVNKLWDAALKGGRF